MRAAVCVPEHPRNLHHGLPLLHHPRSSPSEDGVEPATGGGQVYQADSAEELGDIHRVQAGRSCRLLGWQEQEP